MKVQPMVLFHTPMSSAEINDWIDLHPPEDRAAMYTVMGMTWNFLANTINNHVDDSPNNDDEVQEV